MTSAWLLPEHLADVLPHQARRIEELRRSLLDVARSYGYELVMPPLLEHLESLLSGTGSELDLRTFKLVDQLSGRTLGVRADITPQVARIDAHLLNRTGVTRLCYCGPVLHTRPAGPVATREPLQFGAEIYGHAGLEADLEIGHLAIDCISRTGVQTLVMDFADARVLRGLLDGVTLPSAQLQALHAALAAKDASALGDATTDLAAPLRRALTGLLDLYGGVDVIDRAGRVLPHHALIDAALRDLRGLVDRLRAQHHEVSFGVDLADLSGYAYYSGTKFALYAPGSTSALLRGGRYDDVGAVFGRNRCAVGFSLDLKPVAELSDRDGRRSAIRAPWGEQPGLLAAVRQLREQGDTVVCVLPGHEHETDEFDCDRELIAVGDRWAVRALQA
jgi:ATP phosphoribosyltransferase regulatory subunit